MASFWETPAKFFNSRPILYTADSLDQPDDASKHDINFKRDFVGPYEIVQI